MYVCVCNQVTDHEIRRAVDDGADSMTVLQSTLKVATCCGRCHDCAKRVMNQALADQCMACDMLATA